MSLNRRIRYLGVILIAVMIVMALLIAARDYRFEWTDMQKGLLEFRPGAKTFSPDNGDSYGVLNRGPNFALTAGTYRLTLNIDSDEENVVQIRTSNGARVEPAEIVIPPHSWIMKQNFTLLDDAENLEILVNYNSGSYLAIYEISMSMACTDRIWMIALFLIAALILSVSWKLGWLKTEDLRILVLIGAAVTLASVPVLRENLKGGYDSVFHWGRLRNVVSALKEGQFPVRVAGHMYNGYGSAASIFYPDWMLYFPALLMITGATVQFALSAMMITVNLLTAGNMYVCAKRIFADKQAGCCAAIFYTLASYRLTDAYSRIAYGELMAMAVLPLFILGLWEVIWGDKRKWPMLVMGATAVFQSHMLSTALCAVLAVFICAARIVPIIKENRLLSIFKAAGITVLLNLFFLVPLLDYTAQGIGAGALIGNCVAKALEPVELFVSDVSHAKDIGLALLLGVAVTICAIIGRSDRQTIIAWDA